MIYLIYYIKNEKIKNKKYLIGGIIGTLLLGIIILPYTPIYKNMKITLDYYGRRVPKSSHGTIRIDHHENGSAFAKIYRPQHKHQNP